MNEHDCTCGANHIDLGFWIRVLVVVGTRPEKQAAIAHSMKQVSLQRNLFTAHVKRLENDEHISRLPPRWGARHKLAADIKHPSERRDEVL